jgi:hypothetical protein
MEGSSSVLFQYQLEEGGATFETWRVLRSRFKKFGKKQINQIERDRISRKWQNVTVLRKNNAPKTPFTCLTATAEKLPHMQGVTVSAIRRPQPAFLCNVSESTFGWKTRQANQQPRVLGRMCHEASTRLQGAVSDKAMIFALAAVRTWNVIIYLTRYSLLVSSEREDRLTLVPSACATEMPPSSRLGYYAAHYKHLRAFLKVKKRVKTLAIRVDTQNISHLLLNKGTFTKYGFYYSCSSNGTVADNIPRIINAYDHFQK